MRSSQAIAAESHKTTSLVRVNLLQPGAALVQCSVDSCSDGQGATDNGAHADQEAGEGLRAGFTVDDLHGRDVLRLLVYDLPML